jgi:hypothetical protein
MLERINPALRIVCIALAGLVLYQIAQLVSRKDPLGNLEIATTASARTETAPAPQPAPTPALESNLAPISVTNAAGAPTNRVATSRRPSSSAPAQQPPLEPAVQARVDRITASELFAPVVRPLPMALLGIGGKDAFIRTPNGQTGLMREGDELGGLKLLRIGTNRVLIEHEEQQKELMLFSGFGGESLMPQGEKK